MNLSRRALLCASFALGPAALLGAAPASGAAKPLAGRTVRIAWIDALSGPMGPTGTNQLKSFRFFAEAFSATNPAGVTFEIVPTDNKLSVADSLNALKAAADAGIRYVAQGQGSAVAAALVEAIGRHNERNPGREIVYLNYAAVDPELTNERCSYWHFRFDADTSMKMEALTSFIATRPEVKKVFVLGQNYAHGRQVARYARDMLARKRPDVRIVGDELHPMAQVRDFAPYVAKIKASGADSVITGNWGSDLSLLVKAAQEGGYDGRFFTYYVGAYGIPTALGTAGDGRVYQVAYYHYGMGPPMGPWVRAFERRFGEDFSTGSIVHVFELLGAAMAKARSDDPVKVAAALEGLKVQSFNGEVEMRKLDHQIQQTLYVSRWQKAGPNDYSPEKTGMTLAPVQAFAPYVSSTPTSCRMQRPG